MITKYHMPVDIHFGIGCLKDLATMLTAEDRVLLITDPGLIKVGVADRVLDVMKPTGAEVKVFDGVTPNPTADLVEDAMAQHLSILIQALSVLWVI